MTADLCNLPDCRLLSACLLNGWMKPTSPPHQHCWTQATSCTRHRCRTCSKAGRPRGRSGPGRKRLSSRRYSRDKRLRLDNIQSRFYRIRDNRMRSKFRCHRYCRLMPTYSSQTAQYMRLYPLISDSHPRQSEA
jgi:hypothetical protein